MGEKQDALAAAEAEYLSAQEALKAARAAAAEPQQKYDRMLELYNNASSAIAQDLMEPALKSAKKLSWELSQPLYHMEKRLRNAARAVEAARPAAELEAIAEGQAPDAPQHPPEDRL